MTPPARPGSKRSSEKSLVAAAEIADQHGRGGVETAGEAPAGGLRLERDLDLAEAGAAARLAEPRLPQFVVGGLAGEAHRAAEDGARALETRRPEQGAQEQRDEILQRVRGGRTGGSG